MSSIDNKPNSITEGVIWKQLLCFFFPILLGTFFQQLYNTADAVILGRYVGKAALGAVGGTTSTLTTLMLDLLVGLSAGVTVVIAQHYGAGRYDQVRKAVHGAVAMALVGGSVLSVLGMSFSPFALEMIGAPEEIMVFARTYIQIYFSGALASFLYNVGAAILRGIGDTRRPLFYLMAACLTNILLDLLLVVWLDMGVLGAAVATVLSQIVSAILALRALIKNDYICHLEWREVRFHPALLRNIIQVGFPAAIQANMYTISNIIIQSRINTFGTDTIAAWTAFCKLDGIYWMILSAYGISITTFTGQNLGAGRYDRVRRGVWICLGMTFVTAIFLSLFLFFFFDPLFRIFNSDPGVLTVGAKIVKIMAPFYCTFVFVEIFSGAIRGSGIALGPMLITCSGVCVLRIIWLIFVLPLKWDIETIIVSYPITWIVTSLLFIIYYLHGGWLRRSIFYKRKSEESKSSPLA